MLHEKQQQEEAALQESAKKAREFGETLQQMAEETSRLDCTVASLKQKNSELDKEVDHLKRELQEKKAQAGLLQQDVQQLRQALGIKESEAQRAAETAQQLENTVSSVEKQRAEAARKATSLEIQLQARDNQLREAQQEVILATQDQSFIISSWLGDPNTQMRQLVRQIAAAQPPRAFLEVPNHFWQVSLPAVPGLGKPADMSRTECQMVVEMYSILARGPTSPEAVAVLFMLIAMLSRRIPTSTFYQIAAVYGRLWTAARDAPLSSPALKALVLFAMRELGHSWTRGSAALRVRTGALAICSTRASGPWQRSTALSASRGRMPAKS